MSTQASPTASAVEELEASGTDHPVERVQELGPADTVLWACSGGKELLDPRGEVGKDSPEKVMSVELIVSALYTEETGTEDGVLQWLGPRRGGADETAARGKTPRAGLEDPAEEANFFPMAVGASGGTAARQPCSDGDLREIPVGAQRTWPCRRH